MKRGAQSGFGLFELLVALALVAATAAVGYRVMASATRGIGESERYTRAVLLAESRMAELGVVEALQLGESFGDAGDGYLWRTSVRPFVGYPMRDAPNAPSAPPAPPAPQQLSVVPVEVSVTIAWGSEERPSEVTLTSLRLAPRRR